MAFDYHKLFYDLIATSGTPPPPGVSEGRLYLDANFNLQTIDHAGAVRGIILASGVSALTSGVNASNLPTGDPHINGQLWNNTGQLLISAG
jgi:hypothetical protein